MIVDGNDLGSKELSVDLCIVGSGPAGLTIANQLKGSGLKIAILEAGDRFYSASSQQFYQGDITGEPYESLDIVRLRLFGGTSGHWAGYCSELDPIDFSKREWIADSGWPIKHEQLAAYYPSAKEILDLEKLENLPAVLPTDQSKLQSKLWQFSLPTRFAQKYEDLFANSTNLDLYVNCAVTAVGLNDAGDHASEVTAVNGRQDRLRFRASQFVIACGGIETPRLLLTANPIFKRQSGGQHIGAYFAEHPHFVNIAEVALFPHGETIKRLRHYDRTYSRKMYAFQLPESVQRALQVNNLACELRPRQGTSNEHKRLPSVPAATDMTMADVVLMMEQSPNAQSRVTLSDRKDSNGIPRVDLQWRTRNEDYEACQRSLSHIANQIGASGLGRMRIKTEALQEQGLSLKYWGHHHMGTTRMSDSPAVGVVDTDCRLHGTNNIYIAGSSVFPTVGCVNPTLTIVALSLRLADHLSKQFS